MALIKIVNACRLLGINKSLNVSSFWFEEDEMFLYNNYKHLPKTDKRRKHHTNKEMYSKLQ